MVSKLVARVAEGEEVVITRAGKPVAKLVPLEELKRPRPLGLDAGRYKVPDDFDRECLNLGVRRSWPPLAGAPLPTRRRHPHLPDEAARTGRLHPPPGSEDEDFEAALHRPDMPYGRRMFTCAATSSSCS